MTQKQQVKSDHPIEIISPTKQAVPLVFSSPHSGRAYPEEFLQAIQLNSHEIRRSEDSFVDEIFASVINYGAPLLKALFPRAFIDPNREPYELDPMMFSEPLPDFVNKRSPRVAVGLGTIAKLVANGSEIYSKKLSFTEANRRIDNFYRPYHKALEELIRTTQHQFNRCILIDCHSMPSVGGPMENDAGRHRQVDFIIGDAHGRSCSRALTILVEETLREMGYSVMRNTPYSGGFITRNYGCPDKQIHAIQIEINRGLYMNESIFTRRAEMMEVIENISLLTERLIGIEPQALAA